MECEKYVKSLFQMLPDTAGTGTAHVVKIELEQLVLCCKLIDACICVCESVRDPAH